VKISNRQAAEAQFALGSLLSMDLPIKTSMELALLSTKIDEQVKAFSKVRDALISKYKIQVQAGDKEGEVNFATSMDDAGSAIRDFTEKVSELIETEGEDIPTKVHFPNGTNLRPDTIKSIIQFVEL